jgi:hypothetical protein
MSNPCENCFNLEDCTCKTTQNNTEKQLKINEFKDKTHKIRQISDKSIKKLTKSSKNDENSTKIRNYHLTITDAGSSDGYYLEFSKELTAFEFADILDNIFGIDIDVHYDEDTDISLGDAPQEDIIFFSSLEEVIEFLENKKKDE